MDTSLFFPDKREYVPPEVREVCGNCEVRRACLEFGMHELDGIWGGLTPLQRRRRKRKEQRWAA
jgi:hypothetical protein